MGIEPELLEEMRAHRCTVERHGSKAQQWVNKLEASVNGQYKRLSNACTMTPRRSMRG